MFREAFSSTVNVSLYSHIPRTEAFASDRLNFKLIINTNKFVMIVIKNTSVQTVTSYGGASSVFT